MTLITNRGGYTNQCILAYGISEDGNGCAMCGRIMRRKTQPMCRADVCRDICPYREYRLRVDRIELDNGSEAVCLGRERTKGQWTGCVVMYLKGRCMESDKSIEGDVYGFMKRHVPRVMNDECCPLLMEHMVSGWINERKTRGSQEDRGTGRRKNA